MINNIVVNIKPSLIIEREAMLCDIMFDGQWYTSESSEEKDMVTNYAERIKSTRISNILQIATAILDGKNYSDAINYIEERIITEGLADDFINYLMRDYNRYVFRRCDKYQLITDRIVAQFIKNPNIYMNIFSKIK